MFQISEKGTSKFYNFEKKPGAKFYSRLQKEGGGGGGGGGVIPRSLPTNVKNGDGIKHCVGMIAILRIALLFPSIFCTKLCYEWSYKCPTA